MRWFLEHLLASRLRFQGVSSEGVRVVQGYRINYFVLLFPDSTDFELSFKRRFLRNILGAIDNYLQKICIENVPVHDTVPKALT